MIIRYSSTVGRQASGASAYRPYATNAAASPIATTQTSGLVAVSSSEYRTYRTASARLSSASAVATSGVRAGIHFMAAGTTSRTAHKISNTPTAPHPPRDSALAAGTFASSSNMNTLYDPPARVSRASRIWRTHKRTFIGWAPLLRALAARRAFSEIHAEWRGPKQRPVWPAFRA